MALAETSYDWSKEVNSTDPEYYRWTQWFFKLLFERGLAYQADGMQWWCPSASPSWRTSRWRTAAAGVTRRPPDEEGMRQWFFKITDYAESLLADLDTVDWPDHITQMQRNWIGRSPGCEALFRAENPETRETFDFPIFTTRIDTVFASRT